MSVEAFSSVLNRNGLALTRDVTNLLQVNVGRLCNQACRHCHLEAGPGCTDIMSLETMREVAAFAGRGRFHAVDVTGGAPEMNPHLEDFIGELSGIVPRILLRSNLTALDVRGMKSLAAFLERLRVVIVASFPSFSESQTDSLRGRGVFGKSIAALKILNEIGYGQPGSGLELHLVSNPAGAFLPPPQSQAGRELRRKLQTSYGIVFNDFFCFANVPLGRFKSWLEASGNFDGYVQKLASGFNPLTLGGLMCRTLVSVSWDGILHDCDFHLASGVPMGGRKAVRVGEMEGAPAPGSPIAVADYCYACTAGAGFT